ncbi:YqjF family protein [Oceanobacillus massiliensis]|uniref:YqjF family protein n=1 Tax=Oceanobacillus massiliensis TaxID=1465765 RepID=UPI000289AC9A|nr:DUF2071 domain-containing protein [Oceanobacillus massiliensis]
MDILKETIHRPFPVPSKRWILRQRWRNVSFMHWAVQPKHLRPFIPDRLTIDTYHSQAWIGILVFDMESIHFRGLPKLSLTPRFSEVNVRTYVTYNGVPGIYFLSIDVDNWASSKIAKRWYRLPYHDAAIANEPALHTYHYESIRRKQTYLKAEGSVTPISEIYHSEKKSLDYWLTERYRLYTAQKSALYEADIHHKPWPLQKAEANISRNSHLSRLKIDVNPFSPTVVHFSQGVDTLFWNIKKI